jgi:Mor family transcriptional regulator
MAPQRKFTAEQELEICRRYQAGGSGSQLGKAYKASKACIYKTLRRHGIDRRSKGEARRLFTFEQEQEIGRRYMAGESTCQLGKALEVDSSCISHALDRQGIDRRSLCEAQGGLSDAQKAEVCRRYLAGENTVQLGKSFEASNSTICRILQRNAIETRSADGYGDSVRHVLGNTGHYAQSRECSFYLFELARYSATHCKPGIAFDANDRAYKGKGEYGSEILRLVFATRAEAFFLEQAVLDATRGSADCPEDLADWIGASEVRATPAADLLPIIDRLAAELEAMGHWAFAAAYVPMTTAQRATCQQRALTHSPLF